MSHRWPVLRSIFALVLFTSAYACELHAPTARAPSRAYAPETTTSTLDAPTASSAPEAREPCACADKHAAPRPNSLAGTSATASGPIIAYNGPLAGDVAPSLVAARIQEAGGVPLRLMPHNRQLLADAHALVLVGGDDIDPKRYGERALDEVRLLSPEREAFDFELIEAATNLRLPVLGICLGAQELWVAARGTLIQDIPKEIGITVNHRAKEALHPVTLVPGMKLARIYGASQLRVFSNHHQAVDAGRGVPSAFVVAATSRDGVVEAFESAADHSLFVLGVGWHPEKRDQERVLFDSLVAQARLTRGHAHSSL
jgi:putative glutamine amidotransferase